ncbi:hypothetical protein NKF06_08550 [Haloferax sp. AB510]|uniref:hypothetical protein n=1 Tax=Haloferax sp. AB510 TaxID=2934172 RepID=UPI00209C5E9B|nr:hypothetical protein [Haloferax sp. AB510]MCO8266633.1 hypothetical protein [Haloferax sp. AB510]
MSELDCWFQQDVHSCVADGLGNAFGPGTESVLAMFIVAGVIIPIYAKTGDYVLPATLLVLISGFAATLLPGIIASIAWTVIFMTLVVSLFAALFQTVVQ